MREMRPADRIYIAGHAGMVGSALVRAIRARGFENLILRTSRELDLRDPSEVDRFFVRERPQHVFLAAARVGGIKANVSDPVGFLHDNLLIHANVVASSCRHKSTSLVFLGSSCVYPRDCPQPMAEGSLMTGRLEPTNEGYALAKIAGLKLAQYCHTQYGLDVLNVMPCNLYGTGDHFDPDHSHVLAAMVKRFVDAAKAGIPEVVLWGTGEARRELMHVDDLAAAVLHLHARYGSPEIINVGTGIDVTIRELAAAVAEAAGYRGRLLFDAAMPDGMPRKCLNVDRLAATGYKPKVSLDDGIRRTVEEYRRSLQEVRHETRLNASLPPL